MKQKNQLAGLPNNFNQEEKVLNFLGINSWFSLMRLSDDEINKIVHKTLATSRNLKRLRCIAMFICELKISQAEAALLMHSGIPSIESLGNLTPQELFQKTGRLERLLHTKRKTVVDLKRANLLIQKARNRQIKN